MESNTSGPICEEPFVPADYIEEYWDDANAGLLPAEEVKKARTLEMDYFKKQGVYRKVSVTQCYTEGLRPITVRWLDTNKGDPEKPNYRSRLVAREIKAAKKPEEQLPQNLLFSSMPPLEAMRYLLRVSAKGRRLKLGLWLNFHQKTQKKASVVCWRRACVVAQTRQQYGKTIIPNFF